MSNLTITLSGTGTGTVVSTPAGISCPGTCSHAAPDYPSFRLTATPNPDCIFVRWTITSQGAGGNMTPTSSTSSDQSFTYTNGDANYTINAQFDRIPCNVLTVDPIPTFIYGIPYDQQLVAHGGTGPYTFTVNIAINCGGDQAPPVVCHGLPTGINISSSGHITGTPVLANCSHYYVPVIVTDSFDCSTTTCVEFDLSCFELISCDQEQSPPISYIVTDNLSQYLGLVVQIEKQCFTIYAAPNCIGAITMYPNGVPQLPVFADCIHCNPLKCYDLILCGDTNSPPYTITTSTDLSVYAGKVINYTDLNQSPPTTDCYIVSETFPCYESNPLHGTINNCFPDCECCIPKSPPAPDPPYIPTPPEIDKHTYIVKEDDCDILANKKFANIMFSNFKFVYFGIGSCCNTVDIDNLWIKKELSDYSKLKDHVQLS